MARVGLLVLTASACSVYSVRVSDVPKQPPVNIDSPVKAHLLDGSTVVFRNGVLVQETVLVGPGERYGLILAESTAVTQVLLDSVIALESFRERWEAVPSLGLTVLATGATLVAGAALAVAIFGSCPTVYSDSAGQPVLDGEGFSYSIAPLLEVRDVDRVRARADTGGVVRLEIRDEALETHYLNHLELLAVDHDRGEIVVPDPRGQPLALQAVAAPTRARDRAGRDVRALVADRDGAFFATDSGILAAADVADLEDHIDLDVPVPAGADSVALVLRLRNSLLTTVLFYDEMLAARGPFAVDYLGQRMEEIGHALEIGRFGRDLLGLRVAVWRDGAYQLAARVGDTGPIAWKDVAVLVPATPEPVLHVRLSFTADNWRIDQVGAAAWRRPTVRRVPPARIELSGGRIDTAALAAVLHADAQYLVTTPGQVFVAAFEDDPPPGAGDRAYLIAWQGYYTEWIRRDWLARRRDSAMVGPDRTTLAGALARWRTSHAALEQRFFATKLPVR